MGSGCIHCYWGITATGSSQRVELGSSCIYLDPYTHVHTCLFIYPVMCYLHQAKYEFIPSPPTLIQYCMFHSCFLLLLLCNFPFQQTETWIPLCIIHLLIGLTLVYLESNFKIITPTFMRIKFTN